MIWVSLAYASEPRAPELLRLGQTLTEVHYARAVATPPDRPPTLRGKARSGPIVAWEWPDGTVARWRQAEGKGASVEHWYDAGGIPWVTVHRVADAPTSATVETFPATTVDLTGWTPITVGAALVLGPGPGRKDAEGAAWSSGGGELTAHWLTGEADLADPGFEKGLTEGCGCSISEGSTGLADRVSGARWILNAPHPTTPMIAEVWAFPMPDGMLVVSWAVPQTASPAHPELALGRAAAALITWGAP